MPLRDRLPAAVPWLLALALVTLALKAPALGLWFHSPDDWISLDTGAQVAEGDLAAVGRLFTEDIGRRSSRPVPYLLWAANWRAFGPWAPGYYATNIALNLASGLLIWLLAHRLGRSPAAASLAALWFLLNPITNQGTAFLSARDDELATLFVLLAVTAWPRARGSWPGVLGICALALLAVFSKATALALPLLLLLVDGAELGRRQAMQPRRMLRLYGPVALSLLLFVPALGLLLSGHRGIGGSPAALPQVALLSLAGWLTPHGVGSGLPGALGDALRLGLLGLALGAGRRPKVLLLGGLWVLANLLIPLPMLLGEPGSVLHEGRYLLLPSVGISLVIAAAAPRSPRLLWAASGLTVLCFALFVTPRFGTARTGAPAFVQAARAVAADLPPGGRLLVALQRVDQGLTSLVSSRVFPRLVPELGDRRPLLLRSGGGALFEPLPPGPHGGAALGPLPGDVDLDALDPARDRLLLDVFRRDSPSAPPGAAFGLVALPLPPPQPGADLRWDPAHWSALPPGSEPLRPHRDLPFHQLTGALSEPLPRLPALLQSPPLDLRPAEHCAVELDLVIRPRRPPHAPPLPQTRPLLPEPCFAALLWSESEDWADPWDRFVLLPACSGGPVRARLDTSPAWRASGRIRRLAVLPASVAGEAELRGVVLEGCSGE